ncbi:MAG TPA: membrane dipeptidase [Vicinamibacteria bacterium]|nr:membrane dipeptidase [Vicinamibacteria bacterium]
MRPLAWALVSFIGLFLFFLFDPEPTFRPRETGIVVSDRALAIHRDAIVVDLHVDSLLWQRDLEESGRGGQVDFPRMRQGGLDVAAFTLPTRFFGVAGLKAFHDLWPPSAWFSSHARLKVQMGKTQVFASAHRASDAESIRRNVAERRLSYFHGIEGAHALEGDLSRLVPLAKLGVVFIGLVHLTDNAYGGSSSGSEGLTALGRRLLEEMNRTSVLVDLAHASEQTFFEAIELTAYPPLVSHTGVRAIHDGWRNLSDDQIRAVASKGGVIGVMLAPPGLKEPSLDEAVDHIEHIVAIGGEDTAALGSDFDGYVGPPIDASGLPQLTELMLRRGWSESRVRKVLGENALRLLESR